jgi:hypothetical protein
MKINPFRPNSPVVPGMFVGRLDEIEKLEKALIQTTADSPCHFMIIGERGIGKSSLLLFIQNQAKGKIQLDGGTVNFLVLNVDIDANTSQVGLVNRIKYHLDNELGKSEVGREFLNKTWDFLKKIKIFDSGIDGQCQTHIDDELLLDQFSMSVARISSRICSDGEANIFNAKYDGILLLIDEADNCSVSLNFGSFLKQFIERLQKLNCNKVLIGLAGLTELRDKLYASHKSSVRIFQEIVLGRLSEEDIGYVIDICLQDANKRNSVKTEITEKAKSSLINLSEGFPHFIQQFGYSAFSIDTDNCIDREDVQKSALGKDGALEIIGTRYYRHDFYNKIKKESYRQVLRIMADFSDQWVRRNTIRSRFRGDDSVLNNAIQALRERHIILSKEGEKGVYRLQHMGFALWIKLCAKQDSRAFN